jgi:uncharacterized protein (TIGR02270 family)
LAGVPDRVCPAACILAHAAAPAGIEALAASWRQAPGPTLAALQRGVALAATPSLLAALHRQLHGAAVPAWAALLDAYAFCSVDPGELIDEANGSGEPLLRLAALRLAARLPQRASGDWVERALDDSDPTIANAAIEAGLVHGVPAARRRLGELLDRPSTDCGLLLPIFAILGGPAACGRLIAALSDDRRRRAAVVALGFSGSRAAAEACVELLRQGLVPKLAADALRVITGLDLRARKLVARDPAADWEWAPLEKEELAAPQDEDGLPLPDADGVTSWWQEHRSDFQPEVGYLAGQPVSRAGLLQALAHGPMRYRPPLALALAIQDGDFSLRTDAFTAHQWQSLRRLGCPPAAGLSSLPGGARRG